MKFKAAILYKSKHDLVVDHIMIKDKLKWGQVLIKINYSGICGSQVNEIDAVRGPDKFLPHLLGHEGSGEVVEVGPGVKRMKVGDEVILHWRKGVGIESETPKYYCRNKIINAGWVTTFNEFAIVSENRLTVFDKTKISPIEATLLGCAITTAFGVINNDLNLNIGESILVIGLGGVGLNMVQGAKLAGAHPIIGLEKKKSKLDLAKKIGLDFGSTNLAALKKIINNRLLDGKVDKSVETTGITDLIEAAYELTSNSGKTICVGIPKKQFKAKIDTFPLHFEKEISGSHGGSSNPSYVIPRYINLFHKKKINIKKQILNKFSLDNINIAIKNFRLGSLGRIVIKF